MEMRKPKICVLIVLAGLALFFCSCDNTPEVSKIPASSFPEVVSGKIHFPADPNVSTGNEKESRPPESIQDKSKSDIEPGKEGTAANPIINNDQGKERYDAQGKTDPFVALLQEKTEEVPVDDAPKRILTPLEKIDLTQIRLTAVIIMEKRQIAMVEDADGKGYEVGIGTYIGKNQGRVSDIKDTSIIVTELVKDYQGRIKERIHEIKLHKSNEEG